VVLLVETEQLDVSQQNQTGKNQESRGSGGISAIRVGSETLLSIHAGSQMTIIFGNAEAIYSFDALATAHIVPGN
jgi:hypothetical protein